MTDHTDSDIRDGINPDRGGNGIDPDADLDAWSFGATDEHPTLDDVGPDPAMPVEPASPVHLHVTSARGYRPRGPLWKLAKLLGLDVWGTEFISRRTAMEMQAAALLLFILFCFELSAWTLLFNCLLHGANFVFSAYSLLAVVAAGFFAAAILVFERQIITADFSVEPGRKAAGMVVRCLFILASAVACAQPVELVVFHRAIEARLYLEQVYQNAVQDYEDYLDAREDSRGATIAEIEADVAQTEEHQQWSAALDSQKEADRGVRMAQADLDQARTEQGEREGTLSYWRSQARSAKTNLAADPENPDLASALDRAQRNRSWADSQLTKARQRVGDLETALTVAQGDKGYWAERVDTTGAQRAVVRAGVVETEEADRADGQARLDAIKHRIDTLLAGNPSDAPLDPATGKTFTWTSSGFTDRLAIVWDLVHGRSPRWPATSERVREEVVAVFGLPDPTTEGLGAERTAKTYRTHAFVAFLVALAIPLLSLAFKLLMPPELRHYLRADCQALAGNPEAVREIQAQPGGDAQLDRLFGRSPAGGSSSRGW